MKIVAAALLAFQVQNTLGFAPAAFTKTPITQRPAIVDPSIFADAHQHIDTAASFFSSLNIADASDLVDAAIAPAVTDAVATNGAAAADAVAATADPGNGWFGFLEGPIENLLQIIHTTLVGLGMSADAWGVTIIAMTSMIKLATYPLTASQLKSTTKMQVSVDMKKRNFNVLSFVNNSSVFIRLYNLPLKAFRPNTSLIQK
jgi:hypothetical protein